MPLTLPVTPSSGRGFLWSANRLQPSMAARNYSQHLLERFQAFCDSLELKRDGRGSPVKSVIAPAPTAAPPPPVAPRDAADDGTTAYGGEGLQPRDHVRGAADRVDAEALGGEL